MTLKQYVCIDKNDIDEDTCVKRKEIMEAMNIFNQLIEETELKKLYHEIKIRLYGINEKENQSKVKCIICCKNVKKSYLTKHENSLCHKMRTEKYNKKNINKLV